MKVKIPYFDNISNDLPAGLVVFLVALPLCLGIALASGAPLYSGIIAGVVGGIVVGVASGSQLSVSGPAAGLTVIILSAIDRLGSFEIFLLAVFFAGIIQVILGYLRAGTIGHFFPSSVIKGMLSAIGLILILKQIPHALGDDKDYEGDNEFIQPDGENTFTEIMTAFQNFEPSAILIFIVGMCILILWDSRIFKKFAWTKLIPGPLVVVTIGALLNLLIKQLAPEYVLSGDHLVVLPIAASFQEFTANFTFPDWSAISNPQVYQIAVTLAVIASLETLLSLDAIDKLDPYKRIAPQNRELKAQGLGNIVSGLIGGLPVTSVIVRSSANVSSGGKTKVAAIFHGVLLFSAVVFFPRWINFIPLSALAAVLMMVGFKLTKPSLYQEVYKKGIDQFIPYLVTILAIIFTDLLIGIVVGIVVGLFFVIKTNFHQRVIVTRDGQNFLIRFPNDVSFLNKAFLRQTLEKLPADSYVLIDGSRATFIDEDIMETIRDFQEYAHFKGIKVELKKSLNSLNPMFQV